MYKNIFQQQQKKNKKRITSLRQYLRFNPRTHTQILVFNFFSSTYCSYAHAHLLSALNPVIMFPDGSVECLRRREEKRGEERRGEERIGGERRGGEERRGEMGEGEQRREKERGGEKENMN